MAIVLFPDSSQIQTSALHLESIVRSAATDQKRAWIRWLVTIVVIYTGVSLLRTAAKEKAEAVRASQGAPAAE